MKRNWMQLLAAFFMGVMMPVLAMKLGQAVISVGNPPTVQTGPSAATSAPEAQLPAGQIPVLMEQHRLVLMELDEYLVGVLLGEMPPDFEFEALKAQAVAARTCALQCTLEGTKHYGGAVCTDSKCCQSYLPPERYLAQGGDTQSVDRIRRAVEQTRDQVLTYDGALIQATYFSCSGGQTEDAVAVWGEAVPYLVSVSSPGEEHADIYYQSATFSREEFAACLGRQLTGSCQSWLGKVTYTKGGGVATMVVAGKTYLGTQLRQLLSLNSTAFQMTAGADTVTVATCGKGHRVGMSQYGADAMAAKGSTYRQILSHYYPGTRIDKADTLG